RNPVPWELPDEKTRSTWKSDTSPVAGGFNEIVFDDIKDDEVIGWQAEKNQRALVKNDETITVGDDREKIVRNDETDTTVRDRVEVTEGERAQDVKKDSVTQVDGDRRRLVEG